MVTLATVTVGDAGLAGLRLKTDKLNKRAKRHGMNLLTVTVVSTETLVNDRTGLEYDSHTVEINGRAPCINGYWLAARLENNELIGTVVRVVPGKFADDDYSAYRNHDFGCDHCNSRRRRNDVFVLRRDDNGSTKVVGRNCLADYIRSEDAEDFARYAEFCESAAGWNDSSCADEAFDDGYGERDGGRVFKLNQFLTAVAVCTRRLGWISRTAVKGDPGLSATADDASYLLCGRGHRHEKFVRNNELYASDGDKERADNAIKWAAALTPAETAKSEYLDTIARIATAGATDNKLAGYAASIIRAYDKAREWETERKEKAAGRKERVFIGDAGRKGQQDLGRVRVMRLRSIETDYGVSTIIAMEADMPNGAIAPITWFASGDKVDKYEEGAEYTLRAGIKGHDDDPKWGKQTKVTRAKLTA
jgi:hypothetical protein